MRKLLVLSLALALFAWAQSLFDGTWKMNLSSTTIRGQAGHFCAAKCRVHLLDLYSRDRGESRRR